MVYEITDVGIETVVKHLYDTDMSINRSFSLFIVDFNLSGGQKHKIYK